MATNPFCDPNLRRAGKPIVGRLVAGVVGGLCGCAAPGAECSKKKRALCVAAGVAIGTFLGTLWDEACSGPSPASP